MTKSGIMICGHGSRDKDAEREFALIATALKQRYPGIPVEYGFLEYSAPNIHMGLDSLVAQGVTEIFAIPGMLLAATHAKNDIPSVITTYSEKHHNLTIHYGNDLSVDNKMLSAFEARILEALNAKKGDDLTDTMLVVVGRGTSDSSANADVCKITRLLSEELGFGWGDTVYSGVTYPATGAGLEMLLKLGFKKVVVAPYFLFTGRLIKRITNYVTEVQANHPDINILFANYLKDHERVIDTFVERIEQLRSGYQKPDGLMADFQDRLAKGEVDVHHHHEHSHGHSHSHAPYKHIGHPLGPRTMIGTKNCCCFMGQFPQSIIDEEMQKNKG